MRPSSIFPAILGCLFALGLVPSAHAQWVWKMANARTPAAANLFHVAGSGYYAATKTSTLKSTDLRTWGQSDLSSGGFALVVPGDTVWMGLIGTTLIVYKGIEPVTSMACYGSAPTAATFDGTRFVALYYDNILEKYVSAIWSPGNRWETNTTSGIVGAKGLAWGNEAFLAIDKDNRLHSAKADLVWTPIPQADSLRLSVGPVFHAGLFVALGKGNTLLTSSDGTAWTPRTSGGGSAITRLVVREKAVYALGDSGTILRSSDATVWSALAKPCAKCNIPDLLSESGKLAVAADSKLCRSDDGTGWSCTGDTIRRPSLFKVAHLPGHFLALSDSGRVFHSTDGATWTEGKALPESRYFELISARGQFHALDAHGYVRSTVDGSSWTSSSIGTSYTYTLAEGGGQFLVTADNGLVFVSDSLKTWTKVQPLLARDSSSFTDISTLEMIHDGRRFVSGTGMKEGMYTSVDGKYWRSAGCGSRLIDMVFVHDTIGIAASSLGSTCRSVNGGATWSDGPNRGILDATWADTSFVAVGKSGETTTSREGSSWKKIPIFTSADLNSVTYGDGTLVAVGSGGMILFATSDKTASVQPPPAAAVPSRRRGFVARRTDGRPSLLCEIAGRLEIFDSRGRRILSGLPVRPGEEVALPRSYHGLLNVRLAGSDGLETGAIILP